jgi:hypothetical protein
MANPTMTLIASNTVGSGGVSSVTFSSIPATYTDLLLKISARTNRSAVQDNLAISLNNSSSSFSGITLYGYGSGAGAFSTGGNTDVSIFDGASSTASTFSNGDIYIPNYTSSNYKSWSADSVEENNNTTAYSYLNAGLWSNTAAITSITFASANSASFVQYSTFYLYGISSS